MTSCPGTGALQDWLEGLLDGAERERVASHVSGCARCSAEARRLEHVFRALAAVPLESPSPALAERVLDRVLPSRRRIRWLRRLGAGYAVTLAVCLMGFPLWLTQPSAHTFLAWLAGAASARTVHSLMFILNGLSFLAIQVAGGWGALSAISSRVAAIARVVLVLVEHGPIQFALVLASLLCLGVLWWMRTRAGRTGREMPHVGALGF
jgi:anti-sigma factor RsiW